MRGHMGLMVAAGLAAISGMAAAQMAPPATKSKVDPKVSAIAKSYETAFNARDAAKTAALFAEDAVVNPPNAAAVRGRAAIEASIKKDFEVLSNLVITPTESAISGNLAYDTGTYSMSIKTPSGTVNDKGKYVVLLKKVGDSWLVAHEIFNSDMPLTPGPPAR